MLVIGLTGGIASGKSTVAALFADRYGVPVIDADVITRELTAPGQTAYHAIVAHFGNDILLPNHTLNRTKLRQCIFNDAASKKNGLNLYCTH